MQNPAEAMQDLTKQMGWLNEMFGQEFFAQMQQASVSRPRPNQAPGGSMPSAQPNAPPLEIYVTETEVVVSAILPGLASPGNVAISLTSPNELVLEAVIQPPPSTEPATVLLRERFMGYCHRLLTLPAPVLNTGARVRFADGILAIHLQRADTGNGGGVALLHVNHP